MTSKSVEEREREILGGATIEECLAREGTRFWLRLTDTQREALRRLLGEGGEDEPPTE